MSRWMIFLLALLALPYGYLVFYWTDCVVTSCRFDGHIIFYSFVALVAAPFVMVMIGGGVMMGGVRPVRGMGASGSASPGTVTRGARRGMRFWIGLVLLLTALPTCAALLFFVFYTPKEGRDSLGRICETVGGTTTCRPDPDADHPTELDMLNREMKRKQWFKTD